MYRHIIKDWDEYLSEDFKLNNSKYMNKEFFLKLLNYIIF